MERISIIGGGGTGKTTLAIKLGKILNLPVYHIDGIKYRENWEKRDESERYEILSKYIKEDNWIIDGNFTKSIEKQFRKSDTIIFLDFSLFTQFGGIFKRMIMNLNKEVVGIAGCKEKINLSFLKFVTKFNKSKRQMYLDLLKKEKREKVYVFKNRKSLNRYLESIKNKIEI